MIIEGQMFYNNPIHTCKEEEHAIQELNQISQLKYLREKARIEISREPGQTRFIPQNVSTPEEVEEFYKEANTYNPDEGT